MAYFFIAFKKNGKIKGAFNKGEGQPNYSPFFVTKIFDYCKMIYML
jgi:hypothetical protein